MSNGIATSRGMRDDHRAVTARPTETEPRPLTDATRRGDGDRNAP